MVTMPYVHFELELFGRGSHSGFPDWTRGGYTRLGPRANTRARLRGGAFCIRWGATASAVRATGS